MYDYTCPEGHQFTRIMHSRDAVTVPCSCGAEARRAPIYRNVSLSPWGSEFRWTSSMKSAHDEALGYKAEAQTHMKEAVMNGWKGTSNGDA